MGSVKKTNESSENETGVRKILLPLLGAGLALGSLLRGIPTLRSYKLRSVKEAVARSRGQSADKMNQSVNQKA